MNNTNQKTDNKEVNNYEKGEKSMSLDEIIKSAEFPEDYEAFDDGMLDMIP